MLLRRFMGLGVCVALLSVFSCKSMETSHEEGLALAPVAPPNKLDMGIYWFGPNRATQKAIKGQPNPYYDAVKPTVLFIHGWQRNAQTTGTGRMAYHYQPDPNTEIYTADPWLAKGWNVGAYFWDQLADEDIVTAAENKIWSPRTRVQMRWRDEKGNFRYDGMPKVSVGELIHQDYVDALGDYRGSNIRIVGHSLGSQLAAILAVRIYLEAQKHKVDAHLVPKRVALVDPYFMQRNDAVAWPGALVRAMVRDTRNLIAWEMLKSSGVLTVPILGPLFSDRNLELTSLIGESVFKPDFANAAGNPLQTIINRHNVAQAIYFMSMATASPSCCEGSACTGPTLAGASDEAVRAFMLRGKSCVQKRPMTSFADIADVPQGLYDQPYVDPNDATSTDSSGIDATADSPDSSDTDHEGNSSDAGNASDDSAKKDGKGAR